MQLLSSFVKKIRVPLSVSPAPPNRIQKEYTFWCGLDVEAAKKEAAVRTTTDSTNYTSGGKSISCELFKPNGSTNGGVIVIAYGSDGMIDNAHGHWATMMREYASDLSDKGFIALIPDYFKSTGTAAGSIDYKNGGTQIVLAHRNTWATVLNDGVTHAKTLAGVDPKRVGLLGFSLGGYLCLRIRSTAKVLVEFFAPMPPDGIGAGGGPGLEVQIHHGTKDEAVPFELAALIKLELERGRASVELKDYVGAGHGFVGTDAANTSASTLSRSRTIAFFASKL